MGSVKKITEKLKTLPRILALVVAAGFTTGVAAGEWHPEAVIGGKLRALVYVPTSEPKLAGKRALMVSLHGCRQTNQEFKIGANWQTQADKYGMVVVLPQSSSEGPGGGAGCWHFHIGMKAKRSSSDAKYLLDLVSTMLADPSLNLDPAQVYLTGLSSGGGMSNLLGCLAPDIFAGIGANAGPGLGYDRKPASLIEPNIPAARVAENCQLLAGPHKSYFSTQLYSAIAGSADVRVSPNWTRINVGALVAVYNTNTTLKNCAINSLAGSGKLTTWCDMQGPRASKIIVDGMGHMWPAGAGSSGGGIYIDHQHVNYPEYISQFFFDNNRRVAAVTNSMELSTVTPIMNNDIEPITKP